MVLDECLSLSVKLEHNLTGFNVWNQLTAYLMGHRFEFMFCAYIVEVYDCF